MESIRVDLGDGLHLDIVSKNIADGAKLTIQKVVTSNGDVTGLHTVTCTCTDANGVSHSASVQCPDGATSSCDCSNPASPVAGC